MKPITVVLAHPEPGTVTEAGYHPLHVAASAPIVLIRPTKLNPQARLYAVSCGVCSATFHVVVPHFDRQQKRSKRDLQARVNLIAPATFYGMLLAFDRSYLRPVMTVAMVIMCGFALRTLDPWYRLIDPNTAKSPGDGHKLQVQS